MKRTVRIGILLFLAISILAIRAMDLYLIYYCKNIDLRVLVNGAGLNLDMTIKPLVVKSVAQKDQSGRLTPAFVAGFQSGDRVIALHDARGHGTSILGLNDFGSAWKSVRYLEPWSAEVLRRDGSPRPQRLLLQVPPLPEPDFRLQFVTLVLSVLVPLITISAGLFVGFSKPQNDHAFLASLLFLAFSGLLQQNFHLYPAVFREFAIAVNTTLIGFGVYLFFRFFLLFPSPSLIERRMPQLKNVFLVLTLAAWACSMVIAFARYSSIQWHDQLKNDLRGYDTLSGTLSLIMFGMGLLSLVLNAIKARTGDERRRMAVLAGGALVGLLPLVVYVTYRTWTTSAPPWWFLAWIAVTLAAFPFSFVYVVLKHRVMGIRVILRRGLQYALVSKGFRITEGLLIFVLVYFAAGSFIVNLYPEARTTAIAITTAIITFALLAALQKVDRRVMLSIDKHFFRDALNSQRILTDLSHAVRRLAAQPEELLLAVSARISDSLYPDHVAVFLRGVRMLHQEIDEDVSDGEKVRLIPSTDPTYRCYGVAGRSSRSEEDSLEIQRLTLSEAGFMWGYLEKTVWTEPDAIDVFPDDPKSWARPLSIVLSSQDAFREERAFIEKLNLKLIVPLVSSHRLNGFIAMGEKLSGEPYSREDKELLLSVAEQTAIALDYAQLIGSRTEQEKLKQEMQIAKEVQARLFPQHLPCIRTLDYTGICRAARDVGGDYYDFLGLGPDKLGIALGDVAGKGVSAALLMAGLQAMLRSHAHVRVDAVKELIQDMNHLLVDSTESNKYATFFYGLYDQRQRTLTYVNAGHLPPILLRPVRAGGAPAWETNRLRIGGMVLGMFDDVSYQEETLKMESGDVLIVFSDGISEAMNANEEEFGEERLSALIMRNAHLTSIQLRDTILDEVAAYAGETPQFDDQTLVIARVR